MKFCEIKLLTLFVMAICYCTVYSQDSIPLSLNQAMELASQRNSDVVIAKYNVNSSKFALKEAKGNFLPKIYLDAQYIRNIDQSVTKLGSDNDYNSSLNLSLPLYSNANLANKKYAETGLDFQNEVTRGVQQSVINATKKAYFNYLINQEVVKVQESRLKNAEEFLADIQKRLQRGTLTEFDVSSAKVQVSIAKSNLLEAQSNLIPAENALKLLLGLDADVSLKLTETIEIRSDEMILEEETAQMLQKNSRLKQLELTVGLDENRLQLAKSAYYPTLNAIGNYNYQAHANNFKFSDYNWAQTSLAGLQLQLPIFNGTVTKNKVQQVALNKKISEEEKEYATIETQMKLNELVSQLYFSKLKTDVQQENLLLTADALKLAKKRYDLGVGTILEVNDAELAFTQSRLNWLQAILSYKTTYYDYQLLIGKD